MADFDEKYTNSDGVLLRNSVAGLTSLIPIYESLEHGSEIEWIDHTGVSVDDMLNLVTKDSELEAFTPPEGTAASPGKGDSDDTPDPN